MTSKLTREFMQNIISGHGFGVAPSAVKAMAEFIVAAMDSEPVILYRERNPYNGLTTGWQELTENEFSFLKENAGENAEFVTLYRHAQQPVVRPAPECQHQWRCGGANKLQNQKQCIKCGRVELDAQPAPEYPETLPCPVLLEQGMRFGKGVKTRLVLDAIQRRAEHYTELEAMTPEERAEYDANIEAFKAMLPQPAPIVPDGLIAAVNRLLDSDGSRGCYSAIRCHHAHAEVERLLAAAPQERSVNDVTTGKPLTITLPDISSKAFWSGAGKNETFHPETYRRWVKEAVERACIIASIDVEVK